MVRRKEPLTFHCSVSVIVMICTDVGRTATNEHMPNIAHDAQNVITIGKYLDYLGYRLSIDTSNRYM